MPSTDYFSPVKPFVIYSCNSNCGYFTAQIDYVPRLGADPNSNSPYNVSVGFSLSQGGGAYDSGAGNVGDNEASGHFDDNGFYLTSITFYDFKDGPFILNGQEFLNTEFDATFMIAPVPEPSTWAMMLFGFSALGLFAYQSRKQPAVAVMAA